MRQLPSDTVQRFLMGCRALTAHINTPSGEDPGKIGRGFFIQKVKLVQFCQQESVENLCRVASFRFWLDSAPIDCAGSQHAVSRFPWQRVVVHTYWMGLDPVGLTY